MKRKSVLIGLLVIAVSALVVVTASATGLYDLSWWTADGGGGTFSTNGAYSLAGTIGQPDAGPAMSNGSYSLVGGFMAGLAAGPTPATSVNISGSTSVGGVSLDYDDGGPQTVVSDGNGDYVISVPLHWTGAVTPYKVNTVFTPDHRDYADLTSDQTDQDYSPEGQMPSILQFYPQNGATVCRMPSVGVSLALAGPVRNANGSFDPSTVVLKLDNIDRTGAATIRVSSAFPASEARITYTPPGNLSTGVHTASFTYATPGGPFTEVWSFTAANIACAQ